MDRTTDGLQDYLALFYRRRATMFVAFSIVALSVVFGTLFMDDEYRSTARIAIERPEIPENMVRTTVSYDDTDLRIERIRDRVLSSENIEAWIGEFDLYGDLASEPSTAAAISRFRRDVEIITIQAREDVTVKDQGETIAFDLSYYGESPQQALAVANVLAAEFLEENRGSRNQSVEEIVAFFQRDVDRLSKKIAEAEFKLAEFKERNSGALPESRMVNLQMMDRAERELDDVEREIRDLRESRQILQAELSKVSPNAPIFSETGEAILAGPDRLRMLQQQLVELSAKYGPNHPDVITTRREIELLSGSGTSGQTAVLRQELEIARREYAAARQRYTENHPDVKTLANKVNLLEQQVAAAESSQRSTDRSRPDNPEYISLVVQIEAAEDDIAALERNARALRDRIRKYEELLVEAPQVEREYLALQREYDQAIQDFNEVREKQFTAMQARDLEMAEKGERYVLQRTPTEPTSPAFPNRLAIIILGIILATGVSVGAVVVSESLDSRVRGVKDIRLITGMPPIAVIPMLETAAEERSRTIIWTSAIIGVTAVLVYMIAVQILSF